MTKTLLTAVSAIALLSAVPAIAASTNVETNTSASVETSAEQERTANQDEIPEVTKEDVKEGWNKTKETVSDAADTVAKKTKNAYNSVRDAVTKDSGDFAVNKVSVNTLTTADAIIGEPIYNGDERVGTVKDIILNNSGKPTMVVVADGDFFGIGKLAAFDYNSIVNVNNEGKVIMPLTEQAIDQAAEFSYDNSNYNNNVRMIPSNGYSVANLLDGELTSNTGETLAHIDDIQFKADGSTNLIVSYGQILGLGGEKAAMNFNAATIVKDGNDYNFQLNAQKTAQFENYKETATN